MSDATIAEIRAAADGKPSFKILAHDAVATAHEIAVILNGIFQRDGTPYAGTVLTGVVLLAGILNSVESEDTEAIAAEACAMVMHFIRQSRSSTVSL